MPIAFRLSSSCNGLTVSTMSGGGVLAAVDGTVKTAGEVRQAIQDTLAMRSFQQRLLLNDKVVEEDDTSLRTLGEPPLRLALVSLPYREDPETWQALMDAVDEGQLADVKRLLQLPANPDDLSPTAVRSPPIFIAARHGDPGRQTSSSRPGRTQLLRVRAFRYCATLPWTTHLSIVQCSTRMAPSCRFSAARGLI